ncbi:DedA family protein [Aldersonia sp. NBC_00410]|uniref:DedA family protein n=1 Tax=Aldersonia sp. NBC_00410 TaxID=2975954 RepID=UPI002252679D|nr:DedA family protein [Aldersonia sp. NBC_00410]MCX5043186.1 DedA family protein [Aldersonia sp. NBC_00410]
MDQFLERILDIPPAWIYVVVGLLVFAEDALFFGFVIPGETAAVLGGVAASQDHLSLPLMIGVVVVAAIAGDSVGYEVGSRYGPRLLAVPIMAKRSDGIDRARDLLSRRGGTAVFLGRFIAFFRAVMPGLAGMSKMPYPRFLVYNAVGGITWGVLFVVIGFVAGNSYQAVAKTVGRDVALVVAALVLVGVLIWRVRVHRQRRAELLSGPEPAGTEPAAGEIADS